MCGATYPRIKKEQCTVKPVLNGHSLKDKKLGFEDQLSLNAGQKYCRMLQWEHSAILSTFIKLLFDIKTFALYIFEWPLKTGFTIFDGQTDGQIGRHRNFNTSHLTHVSAVIYEESTNAVERLFLAMPRGCLQFVIVVFPDHTHLLFKTLAMYCSKQN